MKEKWPTASGMPTIVRKCQEDEKLLTDNQEGVRSVDEKETAENEAQLKRDPKESGKRLREIESDQRSGSEGK